MALQLEQGVLTPENLERFIREEVAFAVKEDGATSPNVLRSMVQEEVLRSVQDKGLVEAALSRSLGDSRWVGKIEAAVLQFLKKDFDKVLALGADTYHFRRWDELQAEMRDLRKSTGLEHHQNEVSHTRELVGNVREKHNELSSEVLALRQRLDFATERLEALEGHNKVTYDGFERQKAFHFKILEEQANELREAVKEESSKFAEGFWKELERVEKDIQGLHHDRQWLHRQEEALSSRCRDLEKRLEDGNAWTKESHANTHAVAQEAKGEVQQGVAELTDRVDKSHANLRKLYEDLKENMAGGSVASESRLRAELQDELSKMKAALADGHERQHQQHEVLSQELTASQDASHKAMEGRLHDAVTERTALLDEALHKSQAENKVLHEKLNNAVVKGYEAVEAQFREAIGQQILALRTEFAERQAAGEAQQSEQLHAEVARSEAALEKRMREALFEQVSLLGATQEEGHGRAHAALQAQLHSLRGELQEATRGSNEAAEAAEARLREQLDQHASGVASRLDALEAHKDVAQQEHSELRTSIASGEQAQQAMESRLHATIEDRITQRGEASLGEAVSQESFQRLAKENSHKLHALGYSLLEVIGEVELTGSAGEARAKRSTLHNRLCDRLGNPRVAGEEPTAEAVLPPQMQAAPAEPVPPQTSRGVGSRLREGLMEPPPPVLPEDPSAQGYGDSPVYLPPVHKPSVPPTPRQPKGSGRLSDSLREIRTLRLVDYHGSDWTSS